MVGFRNGQNIALVLVLVEVELSSGKDLVLIHHLLMEEEIVMDQHWIAEHAN